MSLYKEAFPELLIKDTASTSLFFHFMFVSFIILIAIY